MKDFKKWEDLTPEQINLIVNWKPPKYYRWFYKWYKKWIGNTIFFSIVIAGILMIIHNSLNIDLFDVIKGIFFFAFGLVIWALTAYLTKHFATKKFAKSLGLTIENFNYLVRGMTWD